MKFWKEYSNKKGRIRSDADGSALKMFWKLIPNSKRKTDALSFGQSAPGLRKLNEYLETEHPPFKLLQRRGYQIIEIECL